MSRGLGYWDERMFDLVAKKQFFQVKLKVIEKQIVDCQKQIQKNIDFLKKKGSEINE